MSKTLIGTGVLAAIGILVAIGAVAMGEERRSNEPHLAVSISGVPGYVYYNRDYVITFEYANRLGGTAEDVTLSALLPRDFTLDGRVSTPEQQSVIWQLGDLEPGQSGAVTATLRGTVPSDLTNAVYDLPNYVGHTAFVDGLTIDVKLASSGAAVAARATSDTGAANGGHEATRGEITVTKETSSDTTETFAFEITGPFTGFSESFSLADDEDESFRVGRGEYTIRELSSAGWRLDEIDCGREGTVDIANASVSFFLQGGQSVDCIFHNVKQPAAAAAEAPTSTTSQPNVTGALGGIIANSRRDAAPRGSAAAAAAAAAPSSAAPRPAGAATIAPPSTGDGGIH